MSEQIMVRVEHIRQERLCMRGAREWLAHHGIDLRELVETGIPVERVEATGDDFALRVSARARAQASEVTP